MGREGRQQVSVEREEIKCSGRKWKRRKQKKMEWKSRGQDGIIEGNSFKWSGNEGKRMKRKREERNGIKQN